MNELSSILKSNAVLPLAKTTILNLICTNNYIVEKKLIFFKKFELTPPQYNVLRILRGQNMVPINLSSIQERMVHKSSNAGRLVDKLLVKDLVERNTCKENRRKIEVMITNNGLDLLDKIDPLLNSLEIQNLKGLTNEEIIILNSLLEKLRE
jgi:DNA-binding MarR family transcriptional regulator